MSMKNSNDPIGNRTRNLPACSAVPQPTVSLRASSSVFTHKEFLIHGVVGTGESISQSATILAIGL